MSKICVVEDERDMASLVAHNLEKERFEAQVFHDGESFLESLNEAVPDLVILDLMLPKVGGLDVCRMMRADEKTRSVPVIMLTAKGTELDIVLGLELGADDYIVKPFSVRELVARVRAILRRSEDTKSDDVLVFKELSVDRDGFQVKAGGRSVDLTYAEFEILSLLASRPGKVFTRQQLIETTGDMNRVITPKTVDVQVAHIRSKLGEYGELIKTVRGVGYKID